MTVTASAIGRALPSHEDDMYIVGHGIATTNVINPGDWVAFSGTGVIASEDADATYKVSGAGIALDRNPATDEINRFIDREFPKNGINIAFRQVEVYVKNLQHGEQKLDQKDLAQAAAAGAASVQQAPKPPAAP